MRYEYNPEILDQLATHGIRPRSDTAPAFVREYVSDLYRYEIRRLKARLLRKEFPRAEYAGFVRRLRRKYFLLSTSPDHWVTKPIDRALK